MAKSRQDILQTKVQAKIFTKPDHSLKQYTINYRINLNNIIPLLILLMALKLYPNPIKERRAGMHTDKIPVDL